MDNLTDSFSILSVNNGRNYVKRISIINKSKDSIFSLNKISHFFQFKLSYQITPPHIIITLPYYKNGSIENIIPINQDESTIIEIIISIAKQIGQLNTIYLYHGRLKSSNVLITDSGEYIITNYCEYLINDVRYNSWRDIFYESPEVYKNIELMDDKSDVYSIGVIFYELLNQGELPILGIEMKNSKYKSLISKLIECDYRKRISVVELLDELNYIEKLKIEENSDLFCLLLNNKYELNDDLVEKSIKFNEKNLIRITKDFNNSNFIIYSYVLLKLSWKNEKWKKIIDSTIDRKVGSNNNAKDLYFASQTKYGLNLKNKNRLLDMLRVVINKLPELEIMNYYNTFVVYSSRIYENFYMLKNLKYINLSKTSGSNIFLFRLTNQLHYFEHLKSLKLSYNRIENKTFTKIMKNCDIMKELEMLYFTGNNLNNKSIKCFYHNAYKFPKLKLLGLCKNKGIKDKSVKLLLYERMKRNNEFNFMVDITSSKRFDLLYENGYIINKGNVFRSIHKKTIQHIVDLYNKANDKDELFITLYILALASKDNLALIQPRLEGVAMHRDLFKGVGGYEMVYPNTLIDKNAYKLILAVCERVPKLLKIDMYNSFISDDNLYKLLSNYNIRKFKNIKYLDLSYNRLGKKSINKLFSLFPLLQDLTFFGLSDNFLTDNCVDEFTKYFHYLKSIHHIFIGNNNFSEEGTNKLFKSFAYCSTLESISIQSSNITDRSCILLNDLLKKLPLIYYMKLNRNKITDVGIYNLFKDINVEIALKIIDLSDGVKYMFNNRSLNHVTEITLSGNPIKRDDILYQRIGVYDEKYTDVEDILSDFRGENKLTLKKNKTIAQSPNLIHELVKLYKTNNRNKEYFRIISKVLFDNPYSSTRNNFLKEFNSEDNEFKMIEGISSGNSLNSNTIYESNLPFIIESLGYNTFIHSLSLNYIKIPDDLFAELVEKLKRMNSFKDIDIYGCGIGDVNISQLFNSFSSLTTLKTMYINYNSFTCNCSQSLKNFAYLENLQKLVMSGNNLGKDALNILFANITSLKILDTLCLSYSGFTDDNFEYLSKVIKSLKKLVFLNLRKNSITENGIKYLFSTFGEDSFFQLKELYLCDNNISEKGISYLFDGINKHFRELKSLYLSGNVVERVKLGLYERILFYDKDYVDERKIEEMSNNISNLTYYQSTSIVYSPERLLNCVFEKFNKSNNDKDKKKYLYLLFNAINKVTEWNYNTKSFILDHLNHHQVEFETFKGANEHYKLIYDNLNSESLLFLVECSKYISDLSIFILKNTKIDNKVFISLIGEVKRLVSLREIDFSNTGVGDEGMAEMFGILKYLIALNTLNISHNRFTHRITSIFLDEAYNLNKLITLDVSYNDLKEEGCMDILNGIEYTSILRVVNMSGTGFTDRNCKRFAKIMKVLQLKKIYLNDNEITDDGGLILLPQIHNNLYLSICEVKNNKLSDELRKEFDNYPSTRL